MTGPGKEAFDPATVVAALEQHGVRYVLVGGIASVLHGAPTVTTDIDVVPERSEENVRRLVECLRELGAVRTTDADRPPTEPSVDDLRYRIEQFDSPVGPIDIVFEAERVGGYERLAHGADRKPLAGAEVLVASLDDLIMGKQWSDRPKDRSQLRLLIALKEELEAGANQGQPKA